MGFAAMVKARIATTAARVRRMMSVGSGCKAIEVFYERGIKSNRCCNDRLRKGDELVSLSDVELVKALFLLFIHNQRFESSVCHSPSKHLSARSPARLRLALFDAFY